MEWVGGKSRMGSNHFEATNRSSLAKGILGKVHCEVGFGGGARGGIQYIFREVANHISLSQSWAFNRPFPAFQ